VRVPKTGLAVRVALLVVALLISIPNAAHAGTSSAAPAAGRPAQAGAQVTGFCATGSCNKIWNLNGRLLAVWGGQMYNGASVVQWSDLGHDDQRWILDYDADGTFRIRNLATDSASNDYCLDVKDGSLSPAAKVQVWTCNTNAQQYWYWGFSSSMPGYFNIVNWNSDLVLAVWGGTDKIGESVIQYTSVRSNDQYWHAQAL
jgi:hypothetical protein